MDRAMGSVLKFACIATAMLATPASPADCVYKDTMTAAEIVACRDAGAPPDERQKAADAQREERARQHEEKARLIRENIERNQARVRELNRQLAIEAAKPKIPTIGMPADDARKLDWPWGPPERVNKTVTARGTSEQWVYAGNRYLYFTNGVLTAIQE